jgi:hypothetical protein
MVSRLLQRLGDLARQGAWPYEADAQFDAYHAVLRGEPLCCKDVLALDDSSLWALIMRIAADHPDVTARDLARRILERRLFKVVPAPLASLSRFMRRGDREAVLAQCIEKHVPGEPSYYNVREDERSAFHRWSDVEARRAYLVDAAGPGRLGSAKPASEHPDLQALQLGNVVPPSRLFVPAEAVDDVVAVIGPDR